MDEKALQFDRKKHLCYSPAARAMIQEHLQVRFSPSEAESVWERVQLQYVKFLEDTPYLGGKKCTHNGVGGTYDCIAMFAFYEVLEDKPSLEELYEMSSELFLPPFRRLGRLVSLNNPLVRRLVHFSFCRCAAGDKKLEASCPTGYLMRVEPYDPKSGPRYHFDRCPVAEFARAHGLLHIMPALCNGDYPAMAALHGTLLRNHTCSNDSLCDYWIVGDRNSCAKKYPLKTDRDGYWYNETDAT